MRLLICNLVLWVLILTGGCQATSAGTDIPLTASPIPLTATAGGIEMIPTPSPPVDDPKLQNMIVKAKADLAQRLSMPVEDISILDATSVTWPDSSLGCPQEGMMYAQVLTPGYLIRLKAGDREYEYHAGRDASVVYCENPTPPVPGTPGDV